MSQQYTIERIEPGYSDKTDPLRNSSEIMCGYSIGFSETSDRASRLAERYRKTSKNLGTRVIITDGLSASPPVRWVLTDIGWVLQ